MKELILFSFILRITRGRNFKMTRITATYADGASKTVNIPDSLVITIDQATTALGLRTLLAVQQNQNTPSETILEDLLHRKHVDLSSVEIDGENIMSFSSIVYFGYRLVDCGEGPLEKFIFVQREQG